MLATPCRSSHSSGPLRRTPFYELHKESGAKFIDFFGWEMPVLYNGLGVKKEVEVCRKGAAIFDVSHMGQVRIHGPDREKFIEKMTVVDIKKAPYRSLKYTIIPNSRGGTIDDAVVSRLEDHLHLVINSACYDKDMKHFAAHLIEFPGLQLEPLYDTHALVAIQGPKAERTLAALMSPEDAARIRNLKFMTRMNATLGGVSGVIVSRCGYTGEDGFEVCMPIRSANELVRKMTTIPDVAFAGLGARDSLRLEAALTLYGNDLSEDITLSEAGLNWTVCK